MLIGLDIGGTKIEGVLMNPELEILRRLRVDTPKTGYQDFLCQVQEVINELSQLQKIKSIGVGCCGSVDSRTGLIQGANIGYLNGNPFLKDLQKEYSVPVAVSNDANCLAISEYSSGAAKEAVASCLAVIIGTGVGGGIIVNDTVIEGINGLGGEIGHNPLPGFSPDIDGPPVKCYCGSMNCIESFCSGTGFERTWSQKYPAIKSKEIFERAEQGDYCAITHVELYCDQLARVIASLVNIIDPEIVVLGGGMSNQESIYPILNKRIGYYTFRKGVIVSIVQAKNGDSSGVIGAAILPEIKGIL
ncbi:MAG: ROK family protein [Shewanella sp.]|uniref:ROK family protein n=1 Tax=Aeromonas rivipollensis TaxID=948519 RepID=A0AAW9YE56_9GAMM|nr:ROK family protein [Aeromonas rivipollensis]NEX75850.1 ROK family protein [Aeromonas rivipollensis]